MKTRINKHVLMFSNKTTTHVLVYFLQLVLTFTPPPPPLHHNGKGSIDFLLLYLPPTQTPAVVLPGHTAEVKYCVLIGDIGQVNLGVALLII